MATTKRVICLANSRKGGQRCVAGRELIEEGVGGWLRPVSGAAGSIGLWERQYADAVEPQLGDIVELSVLDRENRADHQRENWHLDRDKRWRRVGRVGWSELVALAEGSEPLWPDADASDTLHGRNNRVRGSQTRRLSNSLRLIHVQRLRLHVLPASGTRAARLDGEFSLGGSTYRLAITDPVYGEKARDHLDGSYFVEESLLTISLGEPLAGFCYKLIAGIIERRNFE